MYLLALVMSSFYENMLQSVIEKGSHNTFLTSALLK